MQSIWRKREDGVKQYSSSVAFREMLSDIITNKIREPKEADYENPSWSYLQADHNGYNRALREVLSLIKDKEK